MRARRSCLSVPGVSAKMLEKARTLEADEIIIDLEDSVPADLKARAREQVCAALRAGDWRAPTVAVRINATTSRWCHRDVVELVESGGDRLVALVIPKVEGRADVEFVARLAGMVEKESGRAEPVGLELLIETATGLSRIHESARASERVEALIVGYADLAASLGQPIRDAGDEPADRWHWVLQTVLVAARDAGAQAIDGPYFEVADVDGLRLHAERARSLGYDGKWALHPAQIGPVNEVFSPTPAEFDQAAAVLDELARAEQADGRGAVLLDGQMIDEAMRKQATQVVARGRAAGLGAG
ncbi:MAG TPA: CoA ester lyase [Solirubrobacteraceae bacterium]|nr:CoA ester lyase [Solirubrobacteraceae bacterium]